MNTPPDEFAKHFRELRKSKGWSADRLSISIGRSKSFLGTWERGERRNLDKDVLAKAADVMQLSDAERSELFRLMGKRSAPADAKHLYDKIIDPDANLVEALLDVDDCVMPKTYDAQPVESALTQSLADAASWLLARWALTCGPDSFDFKRIDWGEFYDHGVINRPSLVNDSNYYKMPPPGKSKSIPLFTSRSHKLLASEPKLEITEMSHILAIGYRRWLFSDTGRCRECTKAISSVALSQLGMSTFLSIRFRDSKHNETFGMANVSCDVVADVNQRSLAVLMPDYMTTAFVKNRRYIHVYDKTDTWPRTFAVKTSDMFYKSLYEKGLDFNGLMQHLHIVSDSLYVLQRDLALYQPAWWWDYYSPAMVIKPDRYTFNIRSYDDRVDLVDRLLTLRRKIVNRLKKIKPKRKCKTIDPWPIDQDDMLPFVDYRSDDS